MDTQTIRNKATAASLRAEQALSQGRYHEAAQHFKKAQTHCLVLARLKASRAQREAGSVC